MTAKRLHFHDVNGLRDSIKVSTVRENVTFDLDRVALAIGVEPVDLIARMLRTLAGAIAIDAAELAAEEMRASGRVLIQDGWPDGWPDAQLACVTLHRLFPEKVEA
jgi:hypothetical protein